MRLSLSRRATADLRRLRDFLADPNPAASRKAVSVIFAALRSLEKSPQLGKPGPADFRELVIPFGRAAYIARYRVTGQRIMVHRIWHSREQRV